MLLLLFFQKSLDVTLLLLSLFVVAVLFLLLVLVLVWLVLIVVVVVVVMVVRIDREAVELAHDLYPSRKQNGLEELSQSIHQSDDMDSDCESEVEAIAEIGNVASVTASLGVVDAEEVAFIAKKLASQTIESKEANCAPTAAQKTDLRFVWGEGSGSGEPNVTTVESLSGLPFKSASRL